MADRPNILLILNDDMGFSDLGCYGGEVRTPSLDRLAYHGLRYTQFYNTARCGPSRASLLTGLHPHQAGVGHMLDDLDIDGYVGDLAANTATIEIATGKIEFVNCGHLPPLLIRAGDVENVVELSSGGILIGAIEDPDYEMVTEHLERGDIVVFYTDGISEVRNKNREELGTSGVLQAVEAAIDEDAATIAQSIIAAHEAFSVARYNDDATLIVLRRQRPETSDD